MVHGATSVGASTPERGLHSQDRGRQPSGEKGGNEGVFGERPVVHSRSSHRRVSSPCATRLTPNR
jgi:hypothetical protein